MNKYAAIGLTVVAVAIAAITGVVGYAGGNDGIIEGNWPEGVDVWRVDGKIFQRVRVVDYGEDEGEYNVYYWCEGECDGTTCPIDPNYIPPANGSGNGNGGNGDPTETPIPSTPTNVPPDPTKEPPREPTKESKAACNRGIGNLSENCDPGNSSGQGQGGGRPAGEDRGESEGPPPGNSGGEK